MSSTKHTLPSIQCMLEGAGIQPTLPFVVERTNKPGTTYHRRQASDVIGHLQNLTLDTPTPLEPNASVDRLTATTTTTTTLRNSSIPNWPSPYRPTLLYQHSYHHHRSARTLHSRSYSDYTHPYVTTPPASTSYQELLAPQQQQQQHRRTVSTSTLDSLLHHHHTTRDAYTTTTPPPLLYHSQSSSTLSQSPTLSTPSSVDERHPPHHLLNTNKDDKGLEHTKVKSEASKSDISTEPTTTDDNTTSSNSKYQCPYCQKGFSRPSSLRIHTYSHTGEKPFTCPEPNCDRAFSVQSNMRRHIRVHKLNGKHLKLRRSPTPIKPLAAKPSWMHDRSQENGVPLPLN